MKKLALMLLSISMMLSLVACDRQKNASELPNSLPPSIMVEGKLYISSGIELPIEPDESAMKTVTAVIKANELPSKDGEINFSKPDTKYAKIQDRIEYVVVMMDKEWIKFEKREDWGVTLTATQIEPTGLTLEFNQSGGKAQGDLQTGSYYWLEKEVDEKWVTVEMLPTVHDLGWTDEAYIIFKNDVTELEVNWGWLYGELPWGNYRIGKEVMDFKGTGSYDLSNYYAYFEIAK
ncbi:MAG: immunoglobulin-like domain-containing protein [Clostridiaceae bacterium]